MIEVLKIPAKGEICGKICLKAIRDKGKWGTQFF